MHFASAQALQAAGIAGEGGSKRVGLIFLKKAA